MAISVTEILGTDSLSGSRLVINDNFNVLTSEINAMEVYFAPSAGTITNLNNVSTEALRVGLSTILLDINASTFDILTNVRMTGNLTMTGGGIFRNDTSPTTLDATGQSMPATIQVGTSTAIPPYTMYRVGNVDTVNTLTLSLNSGSIGQEIFFVYTAATTGVVTINGIASNLVLPGSATTDLSLNGIGESVHLLAIDNGLGAAVWFIVGGQGYAVS
jgi:hypothetical protein